MWAKIFITLYEGAKVVNRKAATGLTPSGIIIKIISTIIT